MQQLYSFRADFVDKADAPLVSVIMEAECHWDACTAALIDMDAGRYPGAVDFQVTEVEIRTAA